MKKNSDLIFQLSIYLFFLVKRIKMRPFGHFVGVQLFVNKWFQGATHQASPASTFYRDQDRGSSDTEQ